ncbi:MAG: hypothetical protein OHK0029_00820 [Armatimonadaceae bacterium]
MSAKSKTRIAVDVQALQGESRFRGIGRYTAALLEQLAKFQDRFRLVFFSNSNLPEPDLVNFDNVTLRTIAYPMPDDTASNRALLKGTLLAEKFSAYFLPSPIEKVDTVIPDFQGFPVQLYTICYDLIPLLFAERYLADPATKKSYQERLRNIRNSDLVFAISECTRQDCIAHLQMEPERVQTIMGGVSSFFVPLPEAERCEWQKRLQDRFLITKPYILYSGGEDWRKNIEGAIEAFALLPEQRRQQHQLVIACKMSTDGTKKLYELAKTLKVAPDSLIITNFVSDDELRALYSLSHLSIFTSFYEGFGLPVLEAMACGSATLVGNNSSLKELVFSPEQLFDANQPSSISERMEKVLNNTNLLERLRSEGTRHATGFTWEKVAEKTATTLEKVTYSLSSTFYFARTEGVPSKPRLLYFSPLPPLPSGISDYSQELLPELMRHFALDICVEDGYNPQLPVGLEKNVIRGSRLGSRIRHNKSGYSSFLYQMGNSSHHAYIFSMLRRYAGITVMHDYNLCGLINWMATAHPEEGISLKSELTYCYGEKRAAEVLDKIAKDEWGIGDLPMHGIFANRRIFARSLGVIVHNQWALQKITESGEHDTELITKIPLVMPTNVGESRMENLVQLRRKWDIPDEFFVFVTVGVIGPSKRPIQILEAFQEHLQHHPNSFLVFAGPNMMPGDFEQEIHRRGLTNRVRLTGFIESLAQFQEIIKLSDATITLRYPFNGETSSALLRCLAVGKPSIVTDIGSFSEYSADIVHKIPAPVNGSEVRGLVAAMHQMATNREYCRRLGAKAVEWIEREHSPERCAQQYAEFISTVMQHPLTRKRLLADYMGREAALSEESVPLEAFVAFAELLVSSKNNQIMPE